MTEETKPEAPVVEPKDATVATQHTLLIDHKEIAYTALSGTWVLKEEGEGKGDKEGQAEGEKARAAIFFTAYTLDGVEDPATRPITFCYNGGPGSSSVWLHLGAFGPKRVEMGDVGGLLPPPWKLVDNLHTLLDVTDLVFIDPVSTGFSRAIPGERPKQFHGFKKDIESIGDFIRLYTSRNRRWASPKFLAGESYGTTRSAALSGYLQDRHGLFLNGIILISAVLNFQTLEFEPNNELPYVLFLPTYVATAWFHKQLGDDLQARPLEALMDEARRFAGGEYASALLQGAALPQQRRTALLKKLSRYTGLSQDFLDRSDLRIKDTRFFKELLRNRRRSVGRLDSRFIGLDRDSAGETFEHDPSMSAIMGPYSAAFNDYVRSSLGYESDLPYEILNPKVWPWSYAEHENKYVDVAETLRAAMVVNPFLKVFVGNGYFDLATPFYATEYTFNHLSLPPELQSNIAMAYYPAGHMMYVHLPSLEQLKHDLAQFITSAIPV